MPAAGSSTMRAVKGLWGTILGWFDVGGRSSNRSATWWDRMGPLALLGGSVAFVLACCGGMVLSFVVALRGPGALNFGKQLRPSEIEQLEHRPDKRLVTLEDLQLVAPRVEADMGLLSEAVGTGCVWKPKGRDVLWVITNRHVIGLEDDRPRGQVPDVVVRFPTGVEVVPQRIGLIADVDLAVLEIDPASVTEGQDYIALAPGGEEDWKSLRPSTEVAMVGSMLGLDQSHSFGRVGALRDGALDPFTPATRRVQIDGTLLPGNSGGPMLEKTNDGWVWAGINTLSAEGKVGFAIHTSELFRHPLEWFNVPRSGR